MVSKKYRIAGYSAECLASAINGMVNRYMDNLANLDIPEGLSIGYVLTIGGSSGSREFNMVHAEVFLLGDGSEKFTRLGITKQVKDFISIGLNADGGLDMFLEEYLYGDCRDIISIGIRGTLGIGSCVDGDAGLEVDMVLGEEVEGKFYLGCTSIKPL